MPGVGHCSGGPGADLSNADNTAVPFDSAHDVVAALMAWVENGKAPERLIARHVQTNSATGVLNAPSTGTVQLTRPLCVYPKQASWTGSGSSDDAANFVCR